MLTEELSRLLVDAPEPPPLLHPAMADVWRQRIASLRESLEDESAKSQAFEVLRSLIERVMLIPEEGGLAIELAGDLAAMLTFSANKRRPGRERSGLDAQESVVAGARTHLYRTTVCLPYRSAFRL